MQSALLIRLRPLGPWRYGAGDGGDNRLDTLYRSDRLYSAVTLAMRQLGHLEEWLQATAHAAAPAVVFGSLFPFQGDVLFAAPPATLWPPPANLVASPSPVFLTKTRWSAAHFVPLSAIDSLLTGQPLLADQWFPDPESACLLRRDRPSSSPFRAITRSSAAVDRLSQTGSEVNLLAGVEFEAGAGLWTIARFQDAAAEGLWSGRVQGAFKLLADSGFGGGRSKGWGQTQSPDFQKGLWPGLLFPKTARLRKNEAADAPESSLHWLLSLYSPASSDQVDWAGGDYRVILRAGRVQSPVISGALKKQLRLVSEGSVLSASADLVGAAVDVAPDGFAHPVYRSGLALALRLPPARIAAATEKAAEELTATEEEVPVTEQAAPVTEEAAPVATEQEVPVAEQAAPVTEEAAPLATEQEVPVAEQEVPGEPTPAAEATAESAPPEPAIEPPVEVLPEPDAEPEKGNYEI
jgi:CRISPR type III-A-associated RAMP protein Csm4